MKVRHLNCGTMQPPGVGPLVCHVLLIETDSGLVLIDSGFGSLDCAKRARFGQIRRHLIRPVFDPAETALSQIEKLGYERSDVRHIVLTHFDADHIGGIVDFPDAQIHITSAEAVGAMRSRSYRDRVRFRSVQWAHGPRIVEHDVTGEAWRGFAAAKELSEIAPGFVLVSLPGHTRGHACVAVDAGHRWILHSGDAFYHYGTIEGSPPTPVATAKLEKLIAFDRKMVRNNHLRLAELHRRQDPDLMIVCSHDAVLYERARATALV